MALRWTRASTQHASKTAAPISAYPFTLAAWVKSADGTVAHSVFGLDGGSAGTRLALRLTTLSSNNRVALVAGATILPISTASLTGSAWNHVVGVFTSQTSRTVYLNAGSNATDTTSFAFPSLTTIRIARDNGTTTLFDGSMADAAAWNVALGINDITALFKGFRPNMVQPSALKIWYPQYDASSPLINLWPGSLSATITGSPTVANDPNIRPLRLR